MFPLIWCVQFLEVARVTCPSCVSFPTSVNTFDWILQSSIILLLELVLCHGPMEEASFRDQDVHHKSVI